MKALIIDDSSSIRRIFQGILLGSCGFSEVVQTVNGEDGLKELLHHHSEYHVVILDWFMPVMDGIEVLLALRDAKISIPVIICTSAHDKESIINAITAGANEYLIKPFEAGIMQAKVKKVLDEYNARINTCKHNRILIIDDSLIIREAIKRVLLKHDPTIDVVFAEDGAAALVVFAQQHFDVILLDWQMPKMDGIDVLKEIRKTDKHIPVIMITGRSKIDDMVAAFDAGASNFITKPFKNEDLLTMVAQCRLVAAKPKLAH